MEEDTTGTHEKLRANNDTSTQDGKVKMTDNNGKKKSSPKKAARYQQFDDEVELQPGEGEGGGADCGGEKGAQQRVLPRGGLVL